MFLNFTKKIDWLLFIFILPILGLGLITMKSFVPMGTEVNIVSLFDKQLIWIFLSLILFFLFSFIDFRFLRRTNVLVFLFLVFFGFLLFLFIFGSTIRGATSWFSFGSFSFQPVDFMKLILILILAKYFSRRHIEIAHIKHIIISGLYAFIPFILVLLQPDLGSAIIIFLIWIGMILVTGISKKHLLLVVMVGVTISLFLWLFVFQQYQKARILTFLHPLTDIQGAGYNANQSMITTGSGQIIGKGVGYGTQSRLKFLPEYETDFIFSAFAEEWGFIGVIILLTLFGLVIWRILVGAFLGATNFEILFSVGIAIFFMSHIIVNIGMNIGLLPITGTTLPFMSYGGSHLVAEFAGLGILQGMRRYSRSAHRDDVRHEFLGI